MRWERLTSRVRSLEKTVGELFEAVSVLNHKVETIDNEKTLEAFLKEEDRYENENL